MTIAEKLQTIAKKQQEVFDAGKQDVISKSKYVEKTVQGNEISLTDVSEVPHKIKVSADVETEVNVFVNKFFDNNISLLRKVTYGTSTGPSSRNGYKIELPAGTYTFYLTQLSEALHYIYGTINDKEGNYIQACNLLVGPENRTPLTITVNEGDVVYIYDGTTSNLDVSRKTFRAKEIKLVSEATGSEYEYNQTITATPEGTEIDSICPAIDFKASNEITVDYYGSYGMQTEYDKFWDTYQGFGDRTDYQYAFYGPTWTDENFKPKYDIILASGYSGSSLFNRSIITNLAETLEKQRVKLDTSNCGYLASMFQNSLTIRIPEINLTHAADYTVESIASMFSGAAVETIDKLIVVRALQYTSTFFNCANLKNIAFEGTIGNSIDFHWSTLLTKASITNIVEHLSTAASGQTLTLSSIAVNREFETSEGANDGMNSADWEAITANRSNWTIAYA